MTQMTDAREIRIADYDYPLPQERIAEAPLAERDSCRLITAAPGEAIAHHTFDRLPDLLPQDTLLVANNTRVINARLRFRKPSGAMIEIFLLEPCRPTDYQLAFAARGEGAWTALVGNNKRWKEETIEKSVAMPDGRTLTLTARRDGTETAPDGSRTVLLSWTPQDFSFADVVAAAGYIPIPPYLNREARESDAQDYQTVYSRHDGSVAAPTAGLHFTPRLLERLDAKGVERQYVTLHVGAGTFRPVKSETIGGHAMHTETFRITLPLLDSLIAAMEQGRTVTAVGTTTVRTLESLPLLADAIARGAGAHVGQWEAYQGEISDDTTALLRQLRDYVARQPDGALDASTAILVAPGFRWRVVDTLITNFHQPQSTLLLLVDSFLSRDPRLPAWREVYDEALSAGYRFLSYGDACLFRTKAL